MAPTSDASFSMANVPEANGEAAIATLRTTSLPQACGITNWSELRRVLTAESNSIEWLIANNGFQSVFSDFNLSKRIYSEIERYPFDEDQKLEIYFASILPNILPTYIHYETNLAENRELFQMKDRADRELLLTLRRAWQGAEREIFNTLVISEHARAQRNNP